MSSYKNYRRNKYKIKNNKILVALSICITIVAASVITNSLCGSAFDGMFSSANTGDTATASATTVSSMSAEEMDKIIQQISEAASSPNYEAVLDQVIQRAILMGNTELQQYAENKKAIYAAQSQINEQNAINAALAAKNPEIQSLDSKISEMGSSGTNKQNIIQALPQRAGELFATLDDAAWATLSDAINSLSGVMNLSVPLSLSENDRNLLCAVLCQEASNQKLFKDDQLTLIQSYQKAAITRLETVEQARYSVDIYTKLKDASQKIALNYKNAKATTPAQIVLYNQTFTLRNPAITYGNTLMIAVNDAYQFIDATYTKSDHNATITILSNAMRVEMTAGKNITYVNDKSKAMEASMLNFDNVYYIPVEFFASTYDVKYSYSKESQAIIMYNNLNQLKNKATPNKLTQAQ